MAWSLVTSVSSTGSSASSGVNTTGANLIVVMLTYYPPSGVPTSVTDSKGNTWTALTAKACNGNALGSRMFYCYNPTVGSGHTFTNPAAAAHGLGMQAWSGSAASPFDLESGLGNPSGAPTTIQPGSLTPTQDNELIISGVGYYQSGSAASVDSAMTLTDTTSGLYPSGYNHALAYKTQTTATAINPTWTIPATNDGFFVTLMATFKQAAPDTTAPVLSSAVGSGGSLSCSGTVSTDEANGTLYTVFTGSSTTPTKAQIKAGQDDTGSTALRSVSQAVSATGTQTIASGSCTSGTRYMHCMHEDAAGNQSTAVSSASFTVNAAASSSYPGGSVVRQSYGRNNFGIVR